MRFKRKNHFEIIYTLLENIFDIKRDDNMRFERHKKAIFWNIRFFGNIYIYLSYKEIIRCVFIYIQCFAGSIFLLFYRKYAYIFYIQRDYKI